MAVDEATVRRIARLARLGLEESEVPGMVRELNAILTFVAELDSLETRDVPPLTSVVEAVLKQRRDVVDDGGDPAGVLKNAPEPIDSFFTVPKVVE